MEAEGYKENELELTELTGMETAKKAKKQTKHEKLKEVLMSLSQEKESFCKAIAEWEIASYIYDTTGAQCTCSHPHICHIYTLENKLNRNTLEPIGSKCIEHFKDDNLTKTAKLLARRRKKTLVINGERHTYAEVLEKNDLLELVFSDTARIRKRSRAAFLHYYFAHQRMKGSACSEP